jgi:hypothetical protein
MYAVNHVGLVDEKKTKMENLQGELYKLKCSSLTTIEWLGQDLGYEGNVQRVLTGVECYIIL